MLTLRATGRLLERAKLRPEPKPPRSTGKLGDWYANLLLVRPCQVVLCVSQKTLLPVLLPAKDLGRLPERLVTGTRDVLRGLGVAEADIEEELDHMCEIRFAKTASRQVLGTMNDFQRLLDGSARALVAESLALAKAPCGPLGMQSPGDATRALFKRPRLTLVR